MKGKVNKSNVECKTLWESDDRFELNFFEDTDCFSSDDDYANFLHEMIEIFSLREYSTFGFNGRQLMYEEHVASGSRTNFVASGEGRDNVSRSLESGLVDLTNKIDLRIPSLAAIKFWCKHRITRKNNVVQFEKRGSIRVKKTTLYPLDIYQHHRDLLVDVTRATFQNYINNSAVIEHESSDSILSICK